MSQSSTSSERSYIRKYWLNLRRIRFWLVAVAILYTLVGFLVLPWAATSYAVNTVEDDLGRDLRIGSVYTNPFTLTLEVHDLVLDDIDKEELMGFERLYVDLAWSSLFKGTVVIPTARVDNARVYEEQFESGETRFTRLLSEFQNRPLPRDSSKGAIIRPGQTAPTLPIAIKAIDLSLDNFIYAEDAVSPFQVSGEFELGGDFAYEGDIQLLPELNLTGNLDVDKLALMMGEPYVQRFANVGVGSGSLSAEGELQSGPDDLLTYAGSARIDALDIGEQKGNEDVMGWQSLIIDEIDFSFGERSIELSVLKLNQPSARVFIAEDRSTNMGKLMVEQPDTTEVPVDTTEPFDIVIGGARFNSGELNFTDRSLPLPFAAHVQKLRGSISRLSPGQEEATRIDLEGQVGEYGKTQISGKLDPWKPFSRARFDLIFEHMNIPDLTPYAVRFTGRRIAEGRMDLDLGYILDDGQLNATNHIVMRDLMLGEEIESPDATNLPLDLAIALLKDSEGVIRFDIPVEGKVNDPQFSYGPAIEQALTDILKGIISAPFNMLAGLVDGNPNPDELAKVAFAPGSSDVEPPQREALDQLRAALHKRPKLAVELRAPYAPEADRLALRHQKAQSAMVKRLDQEGIDIANPSLKAAETSKTLEAMFTERYPKRTLSNTKKQLTAKADDKASNYNAKAYREHLATEVRDAQTVTKKDLETLAKARTDAVRSFLLAKGEAQSIDPDRVRLVAPIEVEANGKVVLEIGLAAN